MLEGLPPLAAILAAYGLDRVAEEPLEHGGGTGALLTRLTRGDGRRFVLKRDSVERNWMTRVTGDAGLREMRLVHAAPRLPDPVRLPHIAVAADGAETAALMPDLTGMLLKREAPADLVTLDRVLAGLAALHREPWQTQLPPEFPWTDLRTRILLLTRRSASRYEAAGLHVGARLNSGWDAFDRLVRPPVKDLIDGISVDPESLIAALERLPTAGLHGDLELGNVAITAEGAMYLVDWQLTLVAPIAVELGWFLVSNAASLPVTAEAVLERYRVIAGLRDDEAWHAQWDMAVLIGLLLGGWRKGLATDSGVVYPSGKAAAYDLAWWGSQAIGAAGRRL